MTVNRLKHRADARRARSCNHITRWEERRPASALRALLSSTHNGRCFCSVLTAAIVTSLFASCARGTAETTGNYSRISSVESNTEPWRPFSLSCWKRRVKTLLRSSLFLVGFQPSGVTCRTYVCTSKVLPRRMVTSGMVDRGRGGGLVLGFLSLSLSFFFYLVLCLFGRVTGMIARRTRMESFLLAGSRDPRTMKRTPGKKECLPAQPTFPWQLRTLEGNVKRTAEASVLRAAFPRPSENSRWRVFVDRTRNYSNASYFPRNVHVCW